MSPPCNKPAAPNANPLSESEVKTIPVAQLQSFVAEIFTKAGCSAAEGKRIAHYLTQANLVGHDSHGVIRVPRYVEALKAGTVLADQTIDKVIDTPVLAVVDGKYGFGQTVTPQAVQLGIDKAKQSGVAVIALRHSGHLGRAGDWAEMAAAAGLISIHFVNVAGSLLVAPFGGVERRISTAPFCVGVPMPNGQQALILDFATALVAEGKVLVASNGGKKVPDNAMIELDGRMSGDPTTLYGPIAGTSARLPQNGKGAIRTFGEHKGSGLAFMCEILGGALTGGGTCGPGPRQLANGMLSIYMSPDFFGSDHAYAEEARNYIEFFKSAKPATPGGEVLIPGETEARNRADRTKNGVPLQDDTWAAIQAAAKSVGAEITTTQI